MTFIVGPGVQQSLTDHKDEARSDEMYITDAISLTYGKDAIYYYYKQDNEVKRASFLVE